MIVWKTRSSFIPDESCPPLLSFIFSINLNVQKFEVPIHGSEQQSCISATMIQLVSCQILISVVVYLNSDPNCLSVVIQVLETADDLGEVTETVDYYVQGSTIAAGNLFGR